MLKMLIKIDEERLVKDDRYDLDDYWESIDFRFKDNCTKEVLPDGSVLYGGIPSELLSRNRRCLYYFK